MVGSVAIWFQLLSPWLGWENTVQLQRGFSTSQEAEGPVLKMGSLVKRIFGFFKIVYAALSCNSQRNTGFCSRNGVKYVVQDDIAGSTGSFVMKSEYACGGRENECPVCRRGLNMLYIILEPIFEPIFLKKSILKNFFPFFFFFQKWLFKGVHSC